MKTDAQKSDCCWVIVCCRVLHFVDQWLVNTPAGAFCLRAEAEPMAKQPVFRSV